MKDKQFLTWIHERLEHVHGENHNVDYMHKLRCVIASTNSDKVTPNITVVDIEPSGIALNEDIKNLEFYKKFYDDNRVAMLQYESLRGNFNKMIDDVLGGGYYNMGMDVYSCDEQTCDDITRKANKTWLQKLFGY